MKTTFVGDIHGKVHLVRRALALPERVVFLGDFVDSWANDIENQIECLELVMKAVEDDPDNRIVIFGNHELSYLIPNIHRCSGWNSAMNHYMQANASRLFSLFVPAYIPAEGWLATHAGLHPEIKELISDDLNKEFANLKSPVHRIGYSRGGRHSKGGIFWCDFNREFDPIPGLNQIFGHTAGHEIRVLPGKDSTNYCIDCLDHEEHFLTLEFNK